MIIRTIFILLTKLTLHQLQEVRKLTTFLIREKCDFATLKGRIEAKSIYSSVNRKRN